MSGQGYSLQNSFTINTGDDDDIITSTGVIYNEGIIDTSNGDDSIVASFYAVPTLVALRNVNSIETGEGNDTITSTGVIYNEGVIKTGNGDDSIIVKGFESGSNSSGAWFLGEGDDYIKGYGSGDFYGGNGNDTLE
jgi:hypothetical protein